MSELKLPERKKDAIDRYQDNIDWMNRNYSEILRYHADQWIGIYNEGIVAVSGDKRRVNRKMERYVDQRGWNMKEILVYYVEVPSDHEFE